MITLKYLHPVFEYQLGFQFGGQPSPFSDAMAHFENMRQRELPGIIRSKLELIIEGELQNTTERIESRVPEIV